MEKLKLTGPSEKENVASTPQSEQLTRTPYPPFPKGKGTDPSIYCRSPDYEMGKSLSDEDPDLGEKEESQSGSMERKE